MGKPTSIEAQAAYILGEKIYEARKAKNISIKALSMYTNIHHSSISMYETGKYGTNMRFKNIAKICSVLGLDLNMLGRIILNNE